MNARVSVVIPVYNAELFLEESIKSVLNQSYKNIEIIIVNDSSTDGTAAILSRYSAKIKVITNTKNLGDAGSRNRGLLEITGEYYAPMDADDICLPDRILKEVEFLQSQKECVLVGGQVAYINKDSKYLGTSNYPTDRDTIGTHIWRRNPVAHSTVLTRSDLVKKVGMYNEDLKTCSDYDLWLRLVKFGYIANLGDTVIKYRLHSGQMSQYDYTNLLKTTVALQDKYKRLYSHKDNFVDKIYTLIYRILLIIPSRLSNRIVNFGRKLARLIGNLRRGLHD